MLAAGRLVGYLSGAYAVLWHPVVRSEHERGRIVTGMGQLSQDPDGRTGLRAFLMQPPTAGDEALPEQQQVRTGTGHHSDVWATRNLTRALRRQQHRARHRQQQDAAERSREQDRAWWMVRSRLPLTPQVRYLGALAQARNARSPHLWRQEMNRTETLLFHYLAQWPDPFVVRAQVPIGYARVDFLCEFAMLVIEVDGPDHRQPHRQAADQQRDAGLRELDLQIERVSNDDVQADPAGVAARLFTKACTRCSVADHTHPGSPHYGWAPQHPLRPASGPGE